MKRSGTRELSDFYPIRPECQADVPTTRFKPRYGKTLSERRWQASFDEEGRLDIAKVLRRIQRGGVHPSIKGVVMEFLLGCYDPNSTFDERNELKQRRRGQYDMWKAECQKIAPVLGSGKFVTTPLLNEDGQPTDPSLVTVTNPDKKVAQWLMLLHQIGLDVVRTDRSLVFYEDEGNQAKLWDVLSIYAWLDNDIGYVQGMNDICSPLVILIENEADCYWCFDRAMRRMRENFRCTASSMGVQSQLGTLSQIIKTVDPKLHHHLEDLDGGEYLFAFRMLMVLFRREFSFADTLYLWELMWGMEYNPNIFARYEDPERAKTRQVFVNLQVPNQSHSLRFHSSQKSQSNPNPKNLIPKFPSFSIQFNLITMLQSPGHSPLHLSSPSPSISEFSIQNPKDSGSSIQPQKTLRNPTILDEDTYAEALEKIIERDYFPDISKLRDRLDWLEAVKTGDPVQIRDAQLKIIERRRGGKVTTPLNPLDSRNSHTPGSTFVRNFTPLDEFDGKTPVTPGFNASVGEKEEVGAVDTSLGLDQFMGRYTSEDNDSFSKILERVNRKRKERFGYLNDSVNANAIEDEKRDRITDGYGTSYQPPSTLEGWKYTAKNLLMYHPADRGEVPLTEEERAVRIKASTKEIDRPNTRFHGKMMDSRPKDDGTVEVLYTPVAGATPVPMSFRDGDKLKKYDLEDLRKSPNPFYLESGKKAENGYSYVKTPSPAPGADESPFITWGEIEGTPLRLDMEDTPIDIGGSADGPHYRIPSAPARDAKAHSLSREAARNLRERSKMFRKPPLASPARGGSATPSMRTLSPAAQKFVRNAIAKSSSTVDETLRASYRGSSPALATPTRVRSVSRLGRDESLVSRSPSVREGSNPPW